MSLTDAISHLSPELWDRANRALVRKGLAEFSHERLLTPKPLGGSSYSVLSDDGTVEYRFEAQLHALDHWAVDEASITRHRDGSELPLDALDFHIELREAPGLSPEVLPVYLEEISSTLAGSGYKYTKPQVSSAVLAKSSFQDIETGMTEGHPCFVANNGRLGFGVHEYLSYAPETANPVHLVWVAARKDVSTFTAGAGMDYDSFVREELGEETIAAFSARMAELGLDLADYHLLPVHPWQWWNKTTVTFAAEIANRRLVLLGEGSDAYLAQQSIRTFFNTSAPPRSTTSRRRSRCSTWASCGACRPRTWRPRRPSTTGCTSSSRATRSCGQWTSRSSASARRSATTTASTSAPPTATRRTARCWRRCGASPRSPPSRAASGSRRWPRSCTWTPRASPSSAP
ncbi:hypothetical protein GCM10020254_53850 [Streptomyces goshikiensis]